jgi:hypothetical protein
MHKAEVETILGEFTQRVPEGRGNRHGAFHAAVDADRQLTVVRPTKRRGGCKTCEGRGCNGHCRF